MKKLELTKGLSYSTFTFTAKKGIPFEITDEKAEQLIKTGKFAVLEEYDEVIDTDIGTDTGKTETAIKNLDEMKKDEIIAYAAEKRIDISSCKNNDERISIIKAVEAAASNSDDASADSTATPGFENQE